MADVVEILKGLVAIPSVSGEEDKAAGYVGEVLRKAGVEPRMSGRNIWARKGRGEKTLLINAHLDTVPPTDSWTRDPYVPVQEDGKIFGLGANDDKGSLAALLASFIDLNESEINGTLIFSGTCEEEIGGAGLGELVKEIPNPGAVVVGEPTRMEVCSAQKGQVRIFLKARGKAGHAARPVFGENAVVNAARDIVALDDLAFEERDELLGFPTVVSTVIHGGTKGNVIPDFCEVILDVRTTPCYDNERMIEIINKTCRSEVEVRSKRIRPRSTPADSPIVLAALKASGCAEPKAFGGISELFSVPELPGVVMGPGLPAMSHAADEYIEVSQLKSAVKIYTELIKDYLKG